MSSYEISLLWALVLLVASLLTGFTALTNRRPIGLAMVLFVLGGFAVYYAKQLDTDADLLADIPRVVIKLVSRFTD